MRHFAVAALLALAAGPACAAAEAPFDAVCQMSVTSQTLDAAGHPKAPPHPRQVEVRYSFDPAGNRWCEEPNCRTGRISPFESRGDDVLVLDRVDIPVGEASSRYTRSTGVFELFMHPKPGYEGLDIVASGSCREEPFTEPAPPPS